MKYTSKIQLEPRVTAPKALKHKTFKKIEQLSIVFELLGFYSSIPHTFLGAEPRKKTGLIKTNHE